MHPAQAHTNKPYHYINMYYVLVYSYVMYLFVFFIFQINTATNAILVEVEDLSDRPPIW
jgi:hypothetical protein